MPFGHSAVSATAEKVKMSGKHARIAHENKHNFRLFFTNGEAGCEKMCESRSAALAFQLYLDVNKKLN
jgi:hypothetical protein